MGECRIPWASLSMNLISMSASLPQQEDGKAPDPQPWLKWGFEGRMRSDPVPLPHHPWSTADLSPDNGREIFFDRFHLDNRLDPGPSVRVGRQDLMRGEGPGHCDWALNRLFSFFQRDRVAQVT
jgi:hypothetical protein